MTAKSLLSVLAVIGSATVLTVLVAADNAAPAPSPLVKRGDYLVNRVGLCIDCHSPRNERGEFVPGAHLAGAPIGFAPAVPMPWAPVAPPLAGLPTMNDAQALVFLTTGVKPDGSHPRPPMPAYRFNDEDARAVLAYLRAVGKK
jgi:mono/diheme cytochrome c family protein